MTEQEHVGAEGVLLYYHFTPLSTRQTQEQQWYLESCSTLQLVGRVRIARDGVNATLGGDYTSLQKHSSDVAARYNTTSIDFKLTKSRGRKNEQCATESKFTQLTVDIVKEVVTIGLDDLLDCDGDVTAAPVTARHASPSEFHELLLRAAAPSEKEQQNNTERKKETVLVDCRNIYETRIGTFEAEGVTTLDPGTRAFSDLPAWLESNSHKLAGKQVLMCCTGGVRCERASAYLKTLGNCFQGEDVVIQLQGGIERYLQQYGGAGYFKGKNFVFDERGDVQGDAAAQVEKEEEEEKEEMKLREKGVDGISSPSNSDSVQGSCCVCSTIWGEYGARARCSSCRMLVLLCDRCSEEEREEKILIKEKIEKSGGIKSENKIDSKEEDKKVERILMCELCRQRINGNENCTTGSSPTRARMLCLHGFRQTARNFQGRTSALRRQLKHVAEFVYIDAPHTLPDIRINDTAATSEQGKKNRETENGEQKHQNGDEASVAPKTENNKSTPSSSSPSEWEQKRLRRGWILTPEQYTNPNYIPECDEMDHEQYHRQTEGLKESLEYIDTVLDTQGPWDGILGFSQGASLAALLAARECRERPKKEERRFKFVICCSGYPSPLGNNVQHSEEKGEGTTISMPSLHVYGTEKQDRQISESESKCLWEQFDATQRVLLRHNNGHVIPSTKLATARMAEFIAWALREEENKEEED